jgi:hypothetical protein
MSGLANRPTTTQFGQSVLASETSSLVDSNKGKRHDLRSAQYLGIWRKTGWRCFSDATHSELQMPRLMQHRICCLDGALGELSRV